MTQYIALKLSSGEEIIAKLTTSTAYAYVISEPRMIIMQPTGPKTMGIALLPWFISVGEKDFNVDRSLVIASIQGDEIHQAVAKRYMEETSGIDLSGSNAAASILGV